MSQRNPYQHTQFLTAISADFGTIDALQVVEGGVNRGTFGTCVSGNVLRVAVESGVVKYRKNGALLYTSAVTPTYPLLVDAALYTIGATLNNAVISGNLGVVTTRWLVTDHLGTPRIIADQTGSLAGIRRHDYLPFGEELYAGQFGRTPGTGYTADGIRQKFTAKERETGLDFFGARYFANLQGRFTA